MATESSFPPPALRQVGEQVAQLLRERKETVSVAETAAGGLISSTLLSVPGASRFYKGGLTQKLEKKSDFNAKQQLYTLDSRIAFAGWTQENIKNYNGPTPDLVAGFTDHVRGTLGSTYTIGESGTAGPTASGESKNRQPGYVALAVSSDKGTYRKDLDTGFGLSAGGDSGTSQNIREENMVAFAVAALQFFKEVLEGKAKL